MSPAVKSGMKRFQVSFSVVRESSNGHDIKDTISYEVEASNEAAATNRTRKRLRLETFDAYHIRSVTIKVI